MTETGVMRELVRDMVGTADFWGVMNLIQRLETLVKADCQTMGVTPLHDIPVRGCRVDLTGSVEGGEVFWDARADNGAVVLGMTTPVLVLFLRSLKPDTD